MKTEQKLVAAAASLLDSGGEGAVTLRAVGGAVGVSHNAPYKHFKNRTALLAAVAIRDLTMIASAFERIHRSTAKPTRKLKRVLKAFITYGQQYPSRYTLVFSDCRIAQEGVAVKQAAMRCFNEFASIVQECQSSRELPQVAHLELTGLLYATVHGLLDLEAAGHLRRENGQTNVETSINLLIELLSQRAAKQIAK